MSLGVFLPSENSPRPWEGFGKKRSESEDQMGSVPTHPATSPGEQGVVIVCLGLRKGGGGKEPVTLSFGGVYPVLTGQG